MNRTSSITRTSLLASLAFTSVALLTGTMHAQTCPVYPIALSVESLANVQPGTIISNIWNGMEPGNFGWLSWTADPDEPTLITSLTAPGDSYTYVNPDDANDHQINVGDWVSGKPGVTNGKHVRSALNALKGYQIIVPIWDAARGQGENTAYHVAGFAIVQIVDYQLPQQNRITARFLGYADCGGGNTSVPAKETPMLIASR